MNVEAPPQGGTKSARVPVASTKLYNEFSLSWFGDFKITVQKISQYALCVVKISQYVLVFSGEQRFGNPLNVEAPPQGGKKPANILSLV